MSKDRLMQSDPRVNASFMTPKKYLTQTSHLVRPSKNVENTPKIELFTMSFSAS